MIEEEKDSNLRSSRALGEMATRITRLERSMNSLINTLKPMIEQNHALEIQALQKLNKYLDDWRE